MKKKNPIIKQPHTKLVDKNAPKIKVVKENGKINLYDENNKLIGVQG